MKITRKHLRKLINEVYKDYESQKRGERARLGIPGLQQKLKALDDSGRYEDRLMANQLALGLGSKELELPVNPLKINLEFELIKNKARKYLQSTLDYCEWVNSSDERFTPEDEEKIKEFHKEAYELGQEYYRAIQRLRKKLADNTRHQDEQGHVTFGTPEQDAFYRKLTGYGVRPFDDHSSILALIAKEEPKYAFMGRPVKPDMCETRYMYRKFGPRKF